MVATNRCINGEEEILKQRKNPLATTCYFLTKLKKISLTFCCCSFICSTRLRRSNNHPYTIFQWRRSLFVRYGHGRTGLLPQQYASVLRKLPVKLLIEIENPKITALCCTPPIHRPLKSNSSIMHRGLVAIYSFPSSYTCWSSQAETACFFHIFVGNDPSFTGRGNGAELAGSSSPLILHRYLILD